MKFKDLKFFLSNEGFDFNKLDVIVSTKYYIVVCLTKNKLKKYLLLDKSTFYYVEIVGGFCNYINEQFGRTLRLGFKEIITRR